MNPTDQRILKRMEELTTELTRRATADPKDELILSLCEKLYICSRLLTRAAERLGWDREEVQDLMSQLRASVALNQATFEIDSDLSLARLRAERSIEILEHVNAYLEENR